MDKRTVFAEGLVLPRALKVLAHGVLVGEPPNLWLMKDTNGDLKADTKDLVTDKYGSRDANVEHNANSLTWALDNWIYTSEVDMYLRLKHGQFEVQKTPSRGQWGNSQDDAGRIYRNTNESVLHVDIVPTPYYGRNPNLVRTRGSYESLEGDNNEVNAVWPAHKTPGVNRGYQTGVLRPDGRLANFTSVASPLVYRGDRLPADAYGNVFVVEPAANLVSRIVVSDDGTTLKAKKAYEGSEFIAATDERFRPVFLSNAPDGTLYLVDMYRGIIQHRGFITEYLRDHIRLERPRAADRPRPHLPHRPRRRRRAIGGRRCRPRPRRRSSQMLSHPNGWRRDTAQRLLVEREDASVVPALGQARRLRAGREDPAARAVDAGRHGQADPRAGEGGVEGLVARRPDLGAAAVGALAVDRVTPAMIDAVLALKADQDWSVRRQLAATAGTIKGDRTAIVASLLEAGGSDPIVVDAALSGIAGRRSRAAGSDGHRRRRYAGADGERRGARRDDHPREGRCRGAARVRGASPIPREPSGSAARSWPARRTACSVRPCRAAAAVEAVAREPRRRRRARPAPARAAGRVERRRFRLAAAPRRAGAAPGGGRGRGDSASR